MFGQVSDRFLHPFSRLSKPFSVSIFFFFSGAILFCRRAALIRLKEDIFRLTLLFLFEGLSFECVSELQTPHP